MEKYSVLMSVYQKDDANALKESVDSILNQTVKTDNFVIVKDGPLTDELNQILDNYAKKYPEICIITLKKNVGLGKALHTGLLYCKHELVARMDADDIACPQRLEKELNFLKENNLDFVVTGADYLDEEENISPGDTIPNLDPCQVEQCSKYGNVAIHSSWLLKKKIYLKL